MGVAEERFYFRVSLWIRGVLLLGGIMFVAFAVFSLRSETPAVTGLFLFFGLPSLALFVAASRAVFVTQQGIGTRWFGREQFLRWEDIGAARAKADDNLTLVSADQMTSIKIGSGLSGYGSLVEIIRQMRPDLWSIAPQRVFHARKSTFAMWFVFVLIPLGMGIAFLLDAGGQLAGWFFVLVGGLTALVAGKMPYVVKLEGDALVIQSLLGTTRITRADVLSVAVGEVGSANGVPFQGVTVAVRDPRGKRPRVIRFVRFQEGAAVMYASMIAWGSRDGGEA